MNQMINKVDDFLYDDQKSVEQSLEMIVFQNEFIINTLGKKTDDDILQTYYNNFKGINETKNNIHILKERCF